MAEATQSAKPFEINELVLFRGSTCIITDIKNKLGWNTYHMINLDTGYEVRACRYQIRRCPDVTISAITDEVDFDIPEPDHQQLTASRFANVSEDDLVEYENKRTAKSTKSQTSWGVQIFRDFLRANGLPTQFEDLSDDDLATQLRRLYGSLRQANGKVYSRSSYINIRAAINRHLQSPPHSRKTNIMHDAAFMSANFCFTGLLKDLKARGLDRTTHKQAISTEDMQKMYSSGVLSNENPRALQRKVFIELMLQFGRRGREGLREMKKDSIVIRVDAAGRKYATFAYNELTKNHQDVNSDKSYDEQKPLLVAQDIRCPVESLELYISKLNTKCEAFWQRPNARFQQSGQWYDNRAVGINTLADMMKSISQEADLSQLYTNHCLRATSCTVLANHGIQARDICSVTGHRNESSLASYINATPMEKRQEMSAILHSHGMSDSDTLPGALPAPPSPAATSGTLALNSAPAPSCSNPSATADFNRQPPQAVDIQQKSMSWARGNFMSGANFYGPVTFNVGFDFEK